MLLKINEIDINHRSLLQTCCIFEINIMNMTSKKIIDDFLSFKTIALLGASSSNRQKFGNMILDELKSRGYNVLPVHPKAAFISGTKCYNSIDSLPVKPEGVVLVIPPSQTENVIPQIARAGIQYIWIQQGAESRNAINLCVEYGINAISGECLLMYLQNPGFPHNLHKWFRKVIGKVPA